MVNYAFITGASSGFGAAIARALAQEGFGLILTARRLDRLEALKAELKPYSVPIFVYGLDVRNHDEVESLVQGMDESVKSRIEILVNNAGLAAGRASIDNGEIRDWEVMIDTNVKGLLYVSRALIPWMKINLSGTIINITSIAGKEAYPFGNVYCATKSAVDQLTKGMRMDLLPFGIRVTSIAPGAAWTEFSLVRYKGDERAAKDVYEGYQPLLAEDIAETVRFVATRPKHVSIHDLVIMPTAQASATLFKKD